ncbi:hypothetical protein ACKWTF_015952 [Chironomus riparius]
MELFCEYSTVSPFYTDEDIYKCEVIGINRIASNGRVLNIHGTHPDGKSNADVNTLTIFDHQIENFPRYLCNFFPNLKSISVLCCGLKKLSKFDFIGCEGIEKLMLNGNLIKSVAPDVFEYASNLEIISFFMNQISFVPEIVFDGLKMLKYVNFKMNPGIDWCCKEFGRQRNLLAEIKEKLRKDFDAKQVIGSDENGTQEFFEAFKFLENFRDSARIAMEDNCDNRIKMMFNRL